MLVIEMTSARISRQVARLCCQVRARLNVFDGAMTSFLFNLKIT
jgi:hypothetical protein